MHDRKQRARRLRDLMDELLRRQRERKEAQLVANLRRLEYSIYYGKTRAFGAELRLREVPPTDTYIPPVLATPIPLARP